MYQFITITSAIFLLQKSRYHVPALGPFLCFMSPAHEPNGANFFGLFSFFMKMPSVSVVLLGQQSHFLLVFIIVT